MTTYILRRLFSSIPVLFGILFATFALGRMIPSDPCRAILGEKATDEICDRFIREHGLDRPVHIQFGYYLNEIAHGDFGQSFRYGEPVADMIVERLPTTVELSLCALIVAILVGIPLGVISSVRHNSWVDVATMFWANLGVSIPVFLLGLLFQYIFALLLKDTAFQLPPSGRLTSGVLPTPFFEAWGWEAREGFWGAAQEFFSRMNVLNSLLTLNGKVLGDALKHLLLPALALGTIPMALIARMTRSSMLEVLGQDYIRTARAKGLRKNAVVLKHAFRNALLPLATIIGLSLGSLLGGAVLTETIFGLNGVGRILYDAITARDYGIVQAFTVVVAIFFVALNLIVDISYAYLDPRIRLD
ncbi:MAG: ABC transporter permease [Anaerolineales bacterium]|nr:ABC transporter permease [Anaerolineales bacterium]